jgi:hypothetical protein
MLSPMLMLSVHTWSLTAIAALTGVALAWVWRRFSDQVRVAQAKRQIRARLYAMRLYADDPALVLRAQRQLLLWMARYLAPMVRPMAVAGLPLLILCVQLDTVYGHRRLALGESAIITAQLGGHAGLGMPDATLEGRGMMVETQGVRIPGRREIFWRVRAGATTGSVILHVGGAAISKVVGCGRGPNIPQGWWSGTPSVEVSCPAATLDVFGFGIGWEVWFLMVSLITMQAAGLETRRRRGRLPHL